MNSFNLATNLESNGRKFAPGASMMPEEILVDAAQSGEEWAFMELSRRHSPRAFNTIYRVTKNREDAEDALQDSLMKAFLHLKQFDGRSSFSTWFTRIGINSALMILRKKRGSRETSMDVTLDGGDTWHSWDVADHAPDPEKRYAANERTMRLQRAIGRLPNALRSVVEIRQVEDLSMREIADAVGISVPAAKSRLLRARATLSRSLS
jgi:RNA polymerase sigma-70 factor (ECF subfamily)